MPEVYTVEMLPAREGDCLWIEYGDAARPHRIIIDGGRAVAYNTLGARFAALPEDQRTFELLVCTHVDADHIEGLLELVEDPDLSIGFRDVWFNGFVHLKRPTGTEQFGAKQGELLTEGIVDRGWPWNAAFGARSVVLADDGGLPRVELPGGMVLTLLSPDWEGLEAFRSEWDREVRAAGMIPGAQVAPPAPEGVERFGGLSIEKVRELAESPFRRDRSKANATSIAFVAQFGEKTVLFGGDAHADVLERALRRLGNGSPVSLDAFKLSHHGAQGTLSRELLASMRCPNYLVSTDGSRHRHPDREAIARILVGSNGPKRIIGNYQSATLQEWDVPALRRHYDLSLDLPSSVADGTGKIKLL